MAGKRIQEAHRWFQQAVHDLRAAEWNLKGGFYNTVCFLAQQGAEKGLKSFLYYSGARRQALLTHSLVEMVTEASGSLGSLNECLNEARELDLHYIPSRYPNGLPGGYPHQFYVQETAEQAISAARKILSAIENWYLAQGETAIVERPGGSIALT